MVVSGGYFCFVRKTRTGPNPLPIPNQVIFGLPLTITIVTFVTSGRTSMFSSFSFCSGFAFFSSSGSNSNNINIVNIVAVQFNIQY
jgi:hypothetical protein